MRSAAITLKNTWKNSDLLSRLPFSRGGTSDKLLLFLAVSLAAFGLVMVYSASYIYAQEKVGNGLHHFNKHLAFLTAGFAAMAVMRFLNLRLLHTFASWIFFITLGLMALTLIPGIQHRAGGAARWIDLGSITIQPVEFAKLALVVYLAKRFSSSERIFDGWYQGFLIYLWPSALLIFLCMLQPDFGSSALIIATTVLMLYLAGVKVKYLAGAAAAIVPLMVGAILLEPYRMARLLTFLDPWADPQGSGFQIIQSFIAFYRGGLFGVGLGNSRAKIFYLPEAHNDFILSVVGEELGFVGMFILSFVFLLLIFRGIRIAAKCNQVFYSLLAAGLTLLLGFELFWNAAIVLGLFPTKGMNLPFISSGGSSIICALSVVGLLLNISAQEKRETASR